MARRTVKKTRVSKLAEPIVMEHVPVESEFDKTANRVMAAVQELNDALKEAHHDATMRVFLGFVKPKDSAGVIEPAIYKLSHATMTMMVHMRDEPQMAWRAVKADHFKDMAGEGIRAMDKKK